MSAARIDVRVAHKRNEATDICSFELVRPDGAALPAFSAGSHIDVYVPGGQMRQYSLCNPPEETHRYVIGVLRDAQSRGGSQGMHERVHKGDLLHISRPRNHFALTPHQPGDESALLLAGGIGITPLLCMAQHLSASGAPFELHYASRTPDRMAFRERLAGSAFAPRVNFHFDDGAPAQKLDLPTLLTAPARRHLYVCGPQGFMDAVLATARTQGWPAAQIHFEYFAAPATNSAPGEAADRAFDVRIASTGKVYRIAADKSVAAALAEQGVEIMLSCEQGVCGTCLTRVIDGEPDHRDVFLTDDEHARNDCFTPCCSRARSAMLVLDL